MDRQPYSTLDVADNGTWELEEYDSDYRRPDHHRGLSTASLISQQDLSSDSSYKRGVHISQSGRPLRRFYFRSIVGVLGPLVVLCYFIAIWRKYLAHIDPHSPLAFGPPGATWVFYSWFVAGVIGLNLSLYGLAGVEAGMLMEPAWQVGDAMRLMLHADGTWSGPGGWMKVLKWALQIRRVGDSQNRLPGRLWFILALPSIVVFIAWPLSGLCLEMTSGFLHGTPGSGANVTGFVYSNFNERHVQDASNDAQKSWMYAADARIPGHGTVYTPESFDRSQPDFLQGVPVVLPKDEGVEEMFLAAQSETPIEGKAWGLLLHYNCSIVDNVADLRILKDRLPAAENGILKSAADSTSYRLHDNSSFVQIRNDTGRGLQSWVWNMNAVLETAYESWPHPDVLQRLRTSSSNAMFTETASCYFTKNESITGDYPGIERKRVFEALLWQNLRVMAPGTATPPKYNFTLDHNITELYGAYDYYDFAEHRPDQKYPHEPMTAIGVSCTASSSVGTANIDGVRSTYSSFVRTDTPINIQKNRCADRFGAETPVSMLTGEEWLSYLFSSVAAPPPFYAAYTDDPNDIDAATGYMVQLNFLQASQLRQSLLRAYATYAVQLVYNGGRDFSAADGSHGRTLNPNVTAFIAGTVISQGVMPASIPVALFTLWALISTSLCLTYGFRRRWSAILDGHTIFRLGVELTEADRSRIQQHSSMVEIEECSALHDVPGLVGDMEASNVVGRIGLVKGVAADKGRLYQ